MGKDDWKVRMMGKGKFRNAGYAWKVKMMGKDGG